MGWDEMRGSIEMEGMEIFLWWRGEDDIGPSTLPEVGVGKKIGKRKPFFLLAGAHGKSFSRYNRELSVRFDDDATPLLATQARNNLRLCPNSIFCTVFSETEWIFRRSSQESNVLRRLEIDSQATQWQAAMCGIPWPMNPSFCVGSTYESCLMIGVRLTRINIRFYRIFGVVGKTISANYLYY